MHICGVVNYIIYEYLIDESVILETCKDLKLGKQYRKGMYIWIIRNNLINAIALISIAAKLYI